MITLSEEQLTRVCWLYNTQNTPKITQRNITDLVEAINRVREGDR